MCPFEVVYGFVPRAPIDLMLIPSSEKLNFDAKQCAELILKMHETTKENIERMNAKYKLAGSQGRKHLTFEPGDLVWLHLRKDRFPELIKSKLMRSIFSLVVLCIFKINSARCLASKFNFSEDGICIKSIGARGIKP